MAKDPELTPRHIYITRELRLKKHFATFKPGSEYEGFYLEIRADHHVAEIGAISAHPRSFGQTFKLNQWDAATPLKRLAVLVQQQPCQDFPQLRFKAVRS